MTDISNLAKILVEEIDKLVMENRTRASSQFQMGVILDQQRKQIEELEGWKKSALAVMPDFQEIAKLLDLPIGETVHDKIIPAIKSMQEEIENLKSNLSEEFGID